MSKEEKRTEKKHKVRPDHCLAALIILQLALYLILCCHSVYWCRDRRHGTVISTAGHAVIVDKCQRIGSGGQRDRNRDVKRDCR